MELLVALDAGTSSVRAIAFDPAGAVVESAAHEVPVNATSAGWVEQDAGLLAGRSIQVLEELVARLGTNAAQVVAVGITNQRETVVAWDRRDGTLLYPAISWQDT
ncbi:MAG: FGGY family carbohydrate kinase, partial [Actinomycetota bacterium]|nr:FGGY family carbohydrate kinase [Actinomycetota bacterium]